MRKHLVNHNRISENSWFGADDRTDAECNARKLLNAAIKLKTVGTPEAETSFWQTVKDTIHLIAQKIGIKSSEKNLSGNQAPPAPTTQKQNNVPSR